MFGKLNSYLSNASVDTDDIFWQISRTVCGVICTSALFTIMFYSCHPGSYF
jgi:hypothetical protein